MTSPDDAVPTLLDALVIGAGPSGLFTAIELARRGVAPRIVDTDTLPHRQSRATTIMPSTLMLLARAGLADQFIESGMRINCFGLRDAALNQVSAIHEAVRGAQVKPAVQKAYGATSKAAGKELRSVGAKIEQAKKDIIAGKIEVHDYMSDNKCPVS